MTASSKNSVTMNPMYKAGTGWDYDDPNITYDGEFDADGRRVLYDSVGETITMTPQSKNSASMTGQTKT
jgi:hypothetical protein